MVSDTTVKKSLPQRVGQLSWKWWTFIGVCVAVLIAGIVAYAYQQVNGLGTTGLGNVGTQGGVTWGLYVVMVEYFIGVSLAGIVIVAVATVFKIGQLRSISRVAVLLTIGSLVVGVLGVLIDLGRPIQGLINMLLFVRPQSPFFGTFTMVAVGLTGTALLYLYLGGRSDAAQLAMIDSKLRWFHKLWAAGYKDTDAERKRHRQTMFWLSIFIGPLVLVALSTEGLVFGIQVGRPGWYGSMQGPDFLVLAAASSIANLIVLTIIMQEVLHDDGRLVPPVVYKWLGGLLIAMTAGSLYFQVVDLFTLVYATPGGERELADALLTGDYAILFWSSIGLMILGLVLAVTQAARGKWSRTVLIVSSVAISTAVLIERYLTVVPSQTHGNMLPYEPGSYFPSLIEFIVVAGMFALGALMIGLFMKAFPVVPLEVEAETNKELVDA